MKIELKILLRQMKTVKILIQLDICIMIENNLDKIKNKLTFVRYVLYYH